MHIEWLKRDEITSRVVSRIKEVDMVLDIGCGVRPQKVVKALLHICVEPFEQYIGELQKRLEEEKRKNFLIMKGDWAQAVKIFPERSVDSVVLLDVIEHLEKEEGRRLLAQTEKIARQQIIIFTPLGFLPQHHPDGKDAWGMDGGIWQEHRSGWEPEDFDDSYEIYACKKFGRREGIDYGVLWAIKIK